MLELENTENIASIVENWGGNKRALSTVLSVIADSKLDDVVKVLTSRNMNESKLLDIEAALWWSAIQDPDIDFTLFSNLPKINIPGQQDKEAIKNNNDNIVYIQGYQKAWYQECLPAACDWAAENGYSGILLALMIDDDANVVSSKPNPIITKAWINFLLKNPNFLFENQKNELIVEKLSGRLDADSTNGELIQHLKNLYNHRDESKEAKSTYLILKLAQLSLEAGCDPALIQTYLSNQEIELSENIKALGAASNVETAQNTLAAILSILACLTGVGIYFSMKVWDDNLQERGSRFRFFTSGANQASEIVEFQNTKKSNNNT